MQRKELRSLADNIFDSAMNDLWDNINLRTFEPQEDGTELSEEERNYIFDTVASKLRRYR